MASPRTRKRKQQRKALKARLAEAARWAALTHAEKAAENPRRLADEEHHARVLSIYKHWYAPEIKRMIANSALLSARAAHDIIGRIPIAINKPK